MPTITRNAPGTFCWPELGTTDQAAAKTFWGALLGWTCTDRDTGPNGVYTIFQLGGRDAAALYTLGPDMVKAGIPPQWGSYVAVLSADEAAAKAKQLGGTVIMQPFDASENGRMAVIQDPIGATFSVWQANKHGGIAVAGEPGSLAWTQLNAKQPAPAKQFYTQLFGWKMQDDPMPGGGGDYTTLLLNAQPIGGIMPMPRDVPKEAPSHWLNYFASADVDASVKKATGLGGKAIVQPMDIPGVGRFAVIQDPQAAVFAVVRFTK